MPKAMSAAANGLRRRLLISCRGVAPRKRRAGNIPCSGSTVDTTASMANTDIQWNAINMVKM